MADVKSTRYAITNTAAGPRGVHDVDGVYVELAPGETRPVDLTDAEHVSAKGTGYFSFGDADQVKPAPVPPDRDAKGGPGGSLPNNAPKLRKIAKDEGIDVGKARKVADLQAAIIAGRQAKAASAGGGVDLDAMDDDTLRTTVSVVTGKPAAELAGLDRPALLKLARGEE